jgi:hypothetical protein
MARYRRPPTCPHCGKVIAKAVYLDQTDLPLMQRVIGDTFIRWDYNKHTCSKKDLELKIATKKNKTIGL